MDAGLGDNGSVSGQGDKVVPETPCELQGLSSAPCLIALLSAFTKTTEGLCKTRHAPGGESWREEEWFLEGPGVMSQEGKNEERMKICIPQLFVTTAPHECSQHLCHHLILPWVTLWEWLCPLYPLAHPSLYHAQHFICCHHHCHQQR